MVAHHGDHRNPATADELMRKFAFLAEDTLGKEGVKDVSDAVFRLDDMPDIRELTALLRRG